MWYTYRITQAARFLREPQDITHLDLTCQTLGPFRQIEEGRSALGV